MDILKVFIRKMEYKDVDEVMEIESSVYPEHHWSREGFINEINSDLGNYFSLIIEDKVVGYGGFWAILDEGHITTIAIHKDFQGKGLSEILLQQFFETGYVKKLKWFTLEVRISNIKAIKLYEKYKFKSCGVRNKYYQDNQEDALIMWTPEIEEISFSENYQKLKEKTAKKIEIL